MFNTKYYEIQFKKTTIIASEIIDIKMRHTHLLKSKPGELQIVFASTITYRFLHYPSKPK